MPINLRVGAEFDERSARQAAKDAERALARQDTKIRIEAELDEQAVRAAAADSERLLTSAGRDAGTGFARQTETGIRSIDASSAANAMQADFANAGRGAGRSFSTNLQQSAGAAAGAGQDAADGFAGGFAGSAALARLGGAGGPIAAAIGAGALAGLKVVGPQIQAAMAQEFSRDLTQARLGFTDAAMRNVADGAARAFAGNWGDSLEANLGTATSAIQSGLLPANADAGAIQRMIEQLTSVSTILGEDIPAVSRSAAQAIRTGIATDATAAFDLLVTGQQQGLNVSQDLLDTTVEYGTQFRNLGLTGPEAFGLLSQAVKGGARDTDVAADALKEFSIRVVDGSKTTTEAFTALGLNADVMAAKFTAGGRTSANAFDEVLDKIRGIKDPVEQSRIAVALFGTQAEDLAGAMRNFDLSTATNEFGEVENASQRAADRMVSNSQNEWQTAGRNIQNVINNIRDSLNMQNWGITIPTAINDLFTPPPTPPPPGPPGVPAAPAITAPSPPAGVAPGQSPLDIFAPARPGAPALPPQAPAPAPPSAPVAPAAPAAPTPAAPAASVVPAAATATAAVPASKFSDYKLQPNAARANDLIAAAFPQIKTIGGWRADGRSYGRGPSFPDHPSGRALDIMIPESGTSQGKKLGDEINAWLLANKDAIGLVSTIWQKKDHFDHIHALFKGGPASGSGAPSSVAGSPLGSPAAPTAGQPIPVRVMNFDQMMTSASGNAAPAGVAPGGGGAPGGSPDLLSAFFKGLGSTGGWGGFAGGIGSNILETVRGTGEVPIMAHAGEFVVNAHAAQQHLPLLQEINSYQTGGPVGPFPPPPPPPPPKPPPPRAVPSGGGVGGGTVHAGSGAPPGPPVVQGRAPTGHQGTTQASSGGGGGLIGGAASAAAGMFPGGGQAAQIAMQLAMRSAEFGGQLAGIAAGGLMETFLPAGSALGDPAKSWIGRVASAASKVGPATGNTAGQVETPHRPVDPATTQHGTGMGQPPGPRVGVNIEHMDTGGADGQAVARDIERQNRAYGSGMTW